MHLSASEKSNPILYKRFEAHLALQGALQYIHCTKVQFSNLIWQPQCTIFEMQVCKD